jgi:hypothetical protein
MEYDSTQRDLDEYSQALQSYAQSKANIADRNAMNKEDADSYNETMRTIAEPIGGEILKKPLIKGLKSGIKQVLGRGKQVVGSAVEDLKSGVNPTSRIVSGVKRTLADVKSSLVDTTNDIRKLGTGTQKVLNDARLSIGKKPFSKPFDREAFLKTARGKSGFGESGGSLKNPDLNFKPSSLSDIPKSEGSLLDPLKTDIGRATSALEDRTSVSGMDSIIKRVGGNRMSLQEGLFRSQNPSADATSFDSLAPMRNAGGGGVKQSSASVDDSVDPLTGKASVKPKADPGQTVKPKASSKSGDVAEDAENILDKDPAADIEIAGGGPEDIFTDVLAGLVGLGTLIGGAVGGKKPTKVSGYAINPSTQFGI